MWLKKIICFVALFVLLSSCVNDNSDDIELSAAAPTSINYGDVIFEKGVDDSFIIQNTKYVKFPKDSIIINSYENGKIKYDIDFTKCGWKGNYWECKIKADDVEYIDDTHVKIGDKSLYFEPMFDLNFNRQVNMTMRKNEIILQSSLALVDPVIETSANFGAFTPDGVIYIHNFGTTPTIANGFTSLQTHDVDCSTGSDECWILKNNNGAIGGNFSVVFNVSVLNIDGEDQLDEIKFYSEYCYDGSSALGATECQSIGAGGNDQGEGTLDLPNRILCHDGSSWVTMGNLSGYGVGEDCTGNACPNALVTDTDIYNTGAALDSFVNATGFLTCRVEYITSATVGDMSFVWNWFTANLTTSTPSPPPVTVIELTSVPTILKTHEYYRSE